MVLTNALLAAGLSIVASFTNLVPIPPGEAPTRVEDLSDYFVGSPMWPTDLVLVHRGRSSFHIQHGVVFSFVSSDSYMNHGPQTSLSRFDGEPTLTAKQATELAEVLIRRLVTRGDPTGGLPPRVVHLRSYRGQDSLAGPELPFYRLDWFSPKQRDCSIATMEIDARSGRVTSLSLADHHFCDLARSWEMKNRFWVPDPRGTPGVTESGQQTAPERTTPYLTTNQVITGMSSWLRLCRALDIDSSVCTNLAAVKWNCTSLYTNLWISATSIAWLVPLTNGGWFSTVGPVAIAHFSADACYINEWRDKTPEDWFLFEGKIRRRWDDLASGLERKLVEKLGIPSKLLKPYKPQLLNKYLDLTLGGTAVKRVLVEWTNGERRKVESRGGAAWVWENDLGFAAEFDLETGETKSFRLRDPKLIAALARKEGA
jgi:hypothetical protein